MYHLLYLGQIFGKNVYVVPDLRHNEYNFFDESILVNALECYLSHSLLTFLEKLGLDAVMEQNI